MRTLLTMFSVTGQNHFNHRHLPRESLCIMGWVQCVVGLASAMECRKNVHPMRYFFTWRCHGHLFCHRRWQRDR